MPTKEPEMLQSDAFCGHTVQQNAKPRTPYSALPDPWLVLRGLLRGREGEGEVGKEGEKGREMEEGAGRKGIGG